MKDNQKGVTLVITFFVMAIMLAIVLGLSAILFGEFKIIKNIKNSVAAYYLAESGVEKTLYYDKKILPAQDELTGKRGLCNLCSACPPCSGENCGFSDCVDCQASGEDCEPMSCKTCQVTYTSSFANKSFSVTMSTARNGQFIDTALSAKGFYGDTVRAIESNSHKRELDYMAPQIVNALIVQYSPPGEPTRLEIQVDVSDENGINPATVFAHIQNPDENDVGSVLLTRQGTSNTYIGDWSGPVAVYYADISACDTLDNCSNEDVEVVGSGIFYTSKLSSLNTGPNEAPKVGDEQWISGYLVYQDGVGSYPIANQPVAVYDDYPTLQTIMCQDTTDSQGYFECSFIVAGPPIPGDGLNSVQHPIAAKYSGNYVLGIYPAEGIKVINVKKAN